MTVVYILFPQPTILVFIPPTVSQSDLLILLLIFSLNTYSYLQIYTDKAHSLSGGNTQRHLYELIAKFLRLSFRL